MVIGSTGAVMIGVPHPGGKSGGVQSYTERVKGGKWGILPVQEFHVAFHAEEYY
jgi:hypothetical protein